MRNLGSFSSLALVLVVASLLDSPIANATTYRDLCGSVPSACEYTGPDAPVLAAAVCWSRTSLTTRLMTGATCPTGSWPYFAKYGQVDPLTQLVHGYVPLEDACSVPGLCQPAVQAPATTVGDVICCAGGVCWPWDDVGDCSGGELLFCFEGVTNEDGTVTCFESW